MYIRKFRAEKAEFVFLKTFIAANKGSQRKVKLLNK